MEGKDKKSRGPMLGDAGGNTKVKKADARRNAIGYKANARGKARLLGNG